MWFKPNLISKRKIMYKCLFCGTENRSDKARFCTECGPDGPAQNWKSHEVDNPQKLEQYVSTLCEFYFDTNTESEIHEYSLRLRKKLLISHDIHSEVISILDSKKRQIQPLSKFKLEFNENVIDAYAGNDTFLNFKFTNLSDADLFKVNLYWDDPETVDRIDFRAETKNFVKPQVFTTIGGYVIFDRIGFKEINDLQITVSDQFGDKAKFRVSLLMMATATAQFRAKRLQ